MDGSVGKRTGKCLANPVRATDVQVNIQQNTTEIRILYDNPFPSEEAFAIAIGCISKLHSQILLLKLLHALDERRKEIKLGVTEDTLSGSWLS